MIMLLTNEMISTLFSSVTVGLQCITRSGLQSQCLWRQLHIHVVLPHQVLSLYTWDPRVQGLHHLTVWPPCIHHRLDPPDLHPQDTEALHLQVCISMIQHSLPHQCGLSQMVYNCSLGHMLPYILCYYFDTATINIFLFPHIHKPHSLTVLV